jgi:hypothetical protein
MKRLGIGGPVTHEYVLGVQAEVLLTVDLTHVVEPSAFRSLGVLTEMLTPERTGEPEPVTVVATSVHPALTKPSIDHVDLVPRDAHTHTSRLIHV